MAKLSHKSTVPNNAVAHAPFALDKVLDTVVFTFFSRNLFSSVSTGQSKGKSTMAEAVRANVEFGNPANQFLHFVIRQLKKKRSKINPKL